jgi:hypothetical protein
VKSYPESRAIEKADDHAPGKNFRLLPKAEEILLCSESLYSARSDRDITQNFENFFFDVFFKLGIRSTLLKTPNWLRVFRSSIIHNQSE